MQVNSQDSPELRQLRPQVLTAAGFLGHQHVMDQAAALLRQAVAGETVLSPDVTKAVYSLAVGSGDSAAYDTVHKLYEEVGCAGGGLSACSCVCAVMQPLCFSVM